MYFSSYTNEILKPSATKVGSVFFLHLLAKKVGAPKHHLTQLFNIRKQKTFNQYINGLRVEYACIILELNPKEYSIEELAYECGFNSKVSFNRNFKSITGITPSEYRVQL